MVDKGLLLFAFLIGTIAIIASIFASSTIPSIFQTREIVIQTQHHFNQSQIETLNNLNNISQEILKISHELKLNQEQHDVISKTGKSAISLNVNLTKINSKNIQNIMNNITAINEKINNK